MTTRVEFYGALRELAAASEWEAALADGATVADVVAAARTQFPTLAEAELVVAAGLDYVDPTHVVRAGEVISLLPAAE